jgi:hypothetical protein
MRLVTLALCLAAALAVSAQAPITPASVFFDRVRLTSDVSWLERVASSDALLRQEWTAAGARGAVSDELRIDMFVRLGALASPESLAAIARIEAAMRGRRLLADASASGWNWQSAAAGMSGGILSPTPALTVGRRDYAVFRLDAYGPFAPFLSWRDEGGAWSRPRLAGPPSPQSWSFEPHLEARATALVVSYRPRTQALSELPLPPPLEVEVDAITRDTDGDGWSDIEERQLGLNPAERDSDGDGLPDDVDVTPLHAIALSEEVDDEAAVLRSALFAAYGIRGARAAIFVTPGMRALQLYGHAGPVFFGVNLPSRSGCGRGSQRLGPCGPIVGGSEVSWKVGAISPEGTTVTFTNRTGLGFMSTTQVQLRKISGRWIVVGYRLGGIS